MSRLVALSSITSARMPLSIGVIVDDSTARGASLTSKRAVK
jgi:hypothetical protein